MIKTYIAKNYWEKQAEDYKSRCEKLLNEDVPEDAKVVRDALISIFNKFPHKIILEVGCGYGLRIKQIMQNLKGVEKLYGVDISPSMINLTKEYIKDERIKELKVLDASEGLPYKDNSFDIVFNVGVLMHNRPQDALMIVKEMARVSKSIIFSVEDKYVTEIAYVHNYLELYKQAGLKVLESGNFPAVISSQIEIYMIGKKQKQ